jgi:hypothetical protein
VNQGERKHRRQESREGPSTNHADRKGWCGRVAAGAGHDDEGFVIRVHQATSSRYVQRHACA